MSNPEEMTANVLGQTTEEQTRVAAEQPEVSETVVAETETTQSPRYHSMTKEQLMEELKRIIESEDLNAHRSVAAIKAAFYAIRSKEAYEELERFVQEGGDPAAFSSQPDASESAFKDLLAVFRDRRNSYLEAEEQTRMENLSVKKELLERMKAIAADIDNVGANFQTFRQLQQDFRSEAPVPAGAESELWKNFQTVNETFYDCLKMNKELRDLDFKKNLEAKRAIIERARELSEAEDVISAAARMQGLHAEWREIGPVAKELRDSIWEEFKGFSTIVNRRHQEHFEKRKADEQANEQAKEALIQTLASMDLESLKTMGAWDEAGKKVIELQAQWRTLGFASRKNNTTLYSRFRTLCDEFFSRKNEFFKSVKDTYSENLRRKIALCERAENLGAEENVHKAAEQIAALQAEWKTVGPVARKHSDDVWKRFTKACNAIFDARRKAFSAQRSVEQNNLAVKREIVEALRALPIDGDQREVLAKVRELQTRWQETGHVPFNLKDALRDDYRTACDRLYDAYKASAARRNVQKFENRMDRMKGDARGVNRERDRLVQALEQKKSELNTINNNLGFFNVKSSAGSSLVKDIERRASKIQAEIDQIKEKIKVIDTRKADEDSEEA